MMMDYENQFSIAQKLTETAVSTNVVKVVKPGEFQIGDQTITSRLPIPYKDLGKGEQIQLHVQVVEDFTGGTSVQVELQTADNEAFSEGLVTLATSPEIPVAQLKAGYTFNVDRIPMGATKEWIRLRYVVEGTPTAGAVDAGVVADRQTS